MKKTNLYALIALLLFAPGMLRAQNESFNMRQLACNLSQPWEIKFGPDNWLWVTQARSYQLSRVDPATGSTELLLDLGARKNFPNWDGLSANPYVSLKKPPTGF